MKNKQKFTFALAALVVALGVSSAFADTDNAKQGRPMGGPGMKGEMRGAMQALKGKAVVGQISAISGNTVTVLSHGFEKRTATTTYTVDVTNATIFSGRATSTVSSLAVGQNVFVQGAINGTSVTATSVNISFPRQMTDNEGKQMMGNGEPVVGGKITTISGNTVTVTNQANVSYTIDATNAKIFKGKDATTIASLAVGDEVMAQGTVNGTSVTATTIVDRVAPGTMQGQAEPGEKSQGFFSRVKHFFGGLFGF